MLTYNQFQVLNLMPRLQRILLPIKPFFIHQIMQISWNIWSKILDFAIFCQSQNAMLQVCYQKCGVAATNNSVSNTLSMTIVTNSDITSDVNKVQSGFQYMYCKCVKDFILLIDVNDGRYEICLFSGIGEKFCADSFYNKITKKSKFYSLKRAIL